MRDNNLYIKDTATDEIDQITTDGGPDLFHAVPDWVYEEEIFGSRSTFWFSPDTRYMAFLSLNETGVGQGPPGFNNKLISTDCTYPFEAPSLSRTT